MRPFLEKITSRKFLLSLGAFLGSIGASITGLCISNPTITTVGLVCSIISAGLYSAIEATVDIKVGDKDE